MSNKPKTYVVMNHRFKCILSNGFLCLSGIVMPITPVLAQQMVPTPQASNSVSAAPAASITSDFSANTINTADQPKKNDVTFDITQACNVPPYPKPAIPFGLHGDTTLKLMIDKNGKIDAFELLQSSGWKMLDMTAMKAIAGCQVIPPGNWIPSERLIRYKWNFGTGYVSPAKLDEASCKPSEKLRIAEDKEPGLGIVVGIYVSSSGKVVESKLQWGSDNEELNNESLRIAKSCEFNPAENSGKRIFNAESIRFLPRT
ncbi:TonB family protein [Undibacterium sp. SXout11W]|uniref:TonB family protein n=1 Tax=Undibacterium sp. SXout11W TaxID=3413050 RepID=UPI003BF13AF3